MTVLAFANSDTHTRHPPLFRCPFYLLLCPDERRHSHELSGHSMFRYSIPTPPHTMHPSLNMREKFHKQGSPEEGVRNVTQPALYLVQYKNQLLLQPPRTCPSPGRSFHTVQRKGCQHAPVAATQPSLSHLPIHSKMCSDVRLVSVKNECYERTNSGRFFFAALETRLSLQAIKSLYELPSVFLSSYN